MRLLLETDDRTEDLMQPLSGALLDQLREGHDLQNPLATVGLHESVREADEIDGDWKRAKVDAQVATVDS